MKRILPVLFLLFFCAQEATAQKKKDRAKAQITMLKQGALLVRLRTSELQIEGLRKAGKLKEAEEIRLAQEQRNNSIIAAFKRYFNFCKVYFFYSGSSTDISAGKCNGKIFDADQNLYMSFPCDKFLVGEFDKSETTNLDAFIIKDRNYEQLKAPFPYLTRLNQGFVTTRSDEEIVKTLNERLNDFYNK